MTQDFSLKHYMEASGEAGQFPALMEQLAKKDICVPESLKHTLEHSRRSDATLRRSLDEADHYREWRKKDYAERYIGLNAEEIYFGERDFSAPAGEVVTHERRPRLSDLFHELCDAMGLNKFGPKQNEYPRLVLLQSDMHGGKARFWSDPPSVMLSSATFENGSSRMACATMLHELYHILKACKPTFLERIRKTWDRRRAMVAEDLDADAFAKQFGISRDEITEVQIQADQLFMRQQQFARELNQLIAQHVPESEHNLLPAFLLHMQRIAKAKIRLRDEDDPALCEKIDMQTGRPSTQARIKNMRDSKAVLQSPDYWRERLNGEFNRGSLLDSNLTPPAADFQR